MDSSLAPIHVANHWPFIAKQLNLERWDTGRMALEVVAQLQNEHTGAPVPLGRKRLTEGQLTAGQAGAIWRALTELEAMGVLVRCRGAGRRPDDWGFRADVAHWRSMPWKHSGRVVERALGDCISRADCAVSARNPGQSVVFPRGRRLFHIAAADHLPRPWSESRESVDSRGNGEPRAATAKPRAWTPVDSRGNGATIVPLDAPPTVLSIDLEDLLLRTEGAVERHARFARMVDKRAIPGQSVQRGRAPDQKLMRLAIDLDDEQATEARIRWVNEHAQCQVPSGVDDLVAIARAIVASPTAAAIEA